MSGGVVVSSFFTNSAFLLYFNLDSKNVLRKVCSRLKSLVIPYVLWNLIYLALFYGLLISEGRFWEIVINFVVIPFCNVTWYIEFLLFFLIFVKLLYLLMKKTVLSEIILEAVFIGVYYIDWSFIAATELGKLICLDRAISYIPSYFCGIYLALRLKDFVLHETYPLPAMENASGLVHLSVFNLLVYVFIRGVSRLTGVIIPIALWILLPNRWF